MNLFSMLVLFKVKNMIYPQSPMKRWIANLNSFGRFQEFDRWNKNRPSVGDKKAFTKISESVQRRTSKSDYRGEMIPSTWPGTK